MSVSNVALADLLAGLGQPTPAAAPRPRCVVTELLVDQCAHCRPAPPVEPAARLGPWITSAYAGNCADCGSRYPEGTEIRADGDGGWLADCCGNQPEPAREQSLAGLLPPTPAIAGVARAKAAQPCDDPFCGPSGCGWTTAEHPVSDRPGSSLALITPPATVIPAGPPPSTVAEMRHVLDELDRSRPRSRQTALGPSELGTPCQRQIAYKLAGVTRQPEDKRPPWAPMQGTAVHGLMEEALRFHNAQLGRERWVIEERLEVDPGLPGVPGIFGHGDAFDTDNATVVDWKHTGVTTLREVSRKTIPNELLVKPDYRVQGHLYGLGHERAGRTVRWVRLVFLARSHDYSDSREWTEAYDRDIAYEAIMRYYATIDLLAALDVANLPALWSAVPATPGKACAWCPFRRVGGPADQTGCPGDTSTKIDKQLTGLIP